jgi:chromosome segregation protein
MYFKQVELNGFKSFADPTQVNLDHGITAIVGPNGCGKSNILDALRWALGEQSAKALRGAHMQDVIFNGSEQRPATGMAEVSLTFDNADGRLPVDFAEVQITRRIYRSGESEYLLNKAGCRLKDIQELFMDTGIGTNAYSLIGQGKIDLVLSSKPDDRRFLFEEAAGIIKYKTRKRTAIRKLDRADQNLLRLSDIIHEVARQMRSLKRQVNAAIRHREITETLRELEIRNAWLHFNELSGQITDLKERFATAQEEYETASTENGQKEAALEELNLKRIELERMLMARRDGEHQIDSEMERLESAIALLRQKIDFAKEKQTQALEEREDFNARAAELSNVRGEIGERGTALQTEMDAAKAALEKQQAEYEALSKKVAEADTALEAVRQRALDSLNTRNQTQTELETLGVSIANIDHQLESIYGNQESQNARHKELAEQLEGLQGKQGEEQRQLTETVEKRQEAQKNRTEKTQRMQKLNDEWQNLREQKSSQDARLTSLRELRDSYEGFATGVRAIMMAKQRNMPETDGIIGPVGDLLSTDKEYERAIEAALGGNINNIVSGNAEAAKSAIEFLKKHRAGRVTFLPLDTIRPSQRDDTDTLTGQPGIIGKAINYVQCETRIFPALEYLLYNTVIVETIDDAIRIARSERRFPRLVTLDGEVVSSAGAVTGGRTQHDRGGLLGRTAEIEELEVSVEEADKRIKHIGGEAQKLTVAIQELGQSVRTHEEAESGFRAQVNELGVSIAKFATELETLTQSGKSLSEQRDELIGNRRDFESSREGAQERASSMDDDDESVQLAITQAQQVASEARQALSAQGDLMADHRVRMAEIVQSREESIRNQEREQRAQQEAAREAARRLEIVEELKKKEAELEGHIADHVERAKALSETREEAHGKVLESQQEQDKVVKASDALNAELKKLRVKTTESQKEVHRLELGLSQREDRVVHFQERILEEYNLALASLSEKDVGHDEYDEEEREKLIADARKNLQRLGTVNLGAIDEYEELEKRHAFLTSQEEDLSTARNTLLNVVERIDATIKEMFLETFRTVGENFKNYFRRLFNGGQARVYLLDEDDPLESGIEIEARPPGKKPQVISLLSGGEQAMTAIALLFSIFSAKPSPFCVLDEVDAPLDDANIGRFLGLVDEFVERSQFIIITHNKQTMSHADALFGVTQQERGVSQLVSVRFEEVDGAENIAVSQ